MTVPRQSLRYKYTSAPQLYSFSSCYAYAPYISLSLITHKCYEALTTKKAAGLFLNKGKTRQHRTLRTGSNKTKDRPHSLVGHQKDARCSMQQCCPLSNQGRLQSCSKISNLRRTGKTPPFFHYLLFLPRFLLFILFYCIFSSPFYTVPPSSSRHIILQKQGLIRHITYYSLLICPRVSVSGINFSGSRIGFLNYLLIVYYNCRSTYID